MEKLKETVISDRLDFDSSSDDCEGSSQKKRRRLTQRNLFQLWGLDSPMRPSTATSRKNQQGLCPFYKRIPGSTSILLINFIETNVLSFFVHAGTPFTVDAFCYGPVKGCSAYFLTLFHADHYIGLTKGWSHGPIYCTNLTACLLRISLNVSPSRFICPLELGTEYSLKGIKITMLDANRCPGADLIHFRLPNGQCYLHTGDFRASKLMQSYPVLASQRINILYLDTTYCNPKYRFPSKEDVLEFVVDFTRRYLNNHPKTIVVVGAYSIGKEHVYSAISKALGVKYMRMPPGGAFFDLFGWAGISENLSTNGKDTPLHILPISSLRFERYLASQDGQYTSMLSFRPRSDSYLLLIGWTYSANLIKPTSKGNITIYDVPYSEHSNFTELQEFVQFLRPER